MSKKYRKPIIPPDDLPSKFRLHNRTYSWYPTLTRARKRYLIALFSSNRSSIEILDSKSTKITKQRIRLKLKIESVLIWKWDTWTGPKVLWKVPSTTLPDAGTLMQCYTMHKAAGISGMITMEAKGKTLISYFMETDIRLFCLLIVPQEQDPLPLEPLLEKFCTDLVSLGPLEEENLIAKIKLQKFVQSLKGGIPAGTN